MKGIDLLKMAYNSELKPKTIVETIHEKQYFDDLNENDYYIYHNDNMFHRCNKDGKLGSKYQDRFLNYKVLEKEFRIVKILEDKPEHIEKITLDGDENIIYYEDGEKHRFNTNKQNKYFAHKINEISKAVNYLLDKDKQ